MNIFAGSGDKIRFLAINGRTIERQNAEKCLTIGAVYTVDHVNVHSISSEVYLREMPNRPFNTSMFEDVEIDEKAAEKRKNACYNG